MSNNRILMPGGGPRQLSATAAQMAEAAEKFRPNLEAGHIVVFVLMPGIVDGQRGVACDAIVGPKHTVAQQLRRLADEFDPNLIMRPG